MPDMQKIVLDVTTPPNFDSIITHCTTFSMTAIKRNPEFFETLNDCHFEGDSLVERYRCKLDGRIYQVRIRAEK